MEICVGDLSFWNKEETLVEGRSQGNFSGVIKIEAFQFSLSKNLKKKRGEGRDARKAGCRDGRLPTEIRF